LRDLAQRPTDLFLSPGLNFSSAVANSGCRFVNGGALKNERADWLIWEMFGADRLLQAGSSFRSILDPVRCLRTRALPWLPFRTPGPISLP
jgi:hypothetical protein